MKHTVPDCIKFKKLMRRLNAPKPLVVGWLELLWHAAQKNAAAGDIGRYTNEEIAIELEYDGDPDHLVASLVECGWLDECEEHRLVIHDWADHCPNWVKGSLKRHGKKVASAKEPPRDATREVTKEPPREPPREPAKDAPISTLPPNLTQRNVTKPNPTKQRKRVARAVPASCEEVEEYCKQNNKEIDVGMFFDHYASNGWKQANGNPIRDWHAAVRQWERRQNEFGKKENNKQELKF